MSRTERIRDSFTGTPDLDTLRQRSEAGWKLVALEWQREVPDEAPEPETLSQRETMVQPKAAVQPETLGQDVPYGLRVGKDCLHLEEDLDEKEALMTMMELIVRDDPFSQVADELNQRGFRTRSGSPWSPVSVFNMLPRLIEVGPQIFAGEEWEARKGKLMKSGG
jgi:Recombinase